ncbi:hypothetical protein [Aliiroseovarius crassostreae]|uniref:hypothetical protein n=1 Tax=Aliiroseovarius crassostreae TaxID=154981 RepID=UPI00220DA57D|nr:hypothetical protein [Aliiroseovarius crassostreae]UWQ04252.1 hypothetical protein K3X22_11260 [Aliiroseovarius crassostreae]
MGDVLKDIFEAANNRIRSPFVGSILFVFLVVNWMPIYNLLFGDTSVLMRLAYFRYATNGWSLYIWPILGGIGFALLSPWLKHFGAWCAQVPTAKLKLMQDNAAHRHQMLDMDRQIALEERRALAEEKRDRRKIDAAIRENEAEEVGGEELLLKLQAEKEKHYEEPGDETLNLQSSAQPDGDEKLLFDFAGEILACAARDPEGQIFKDLSGGQVTSGNTVFELHKRKDRLLFEEAIEQLLSRGFVEGNDPWVITAAGYRHIDTIRQKNKWRISI